MFARSAVVLGGLIVALAVVTGVVYAAGTTTDWLRADWIKLGGGSDPSANEIGFEGSGNIFATGTGAELALTAPDTVIFGSYLTGIFNPIGQLLFDVTAEVTDFPGVVLQTTNAEAPLIVNAAGNLHMAADETATMTADTFLLISEYGSEGEGEPEASGMINVGAVDPGLPAYTEELSLLTAHDCVVGTIEDEEELAASVKLTQSGEASMSNNSGAKIVVETDGDVRILLGS